MPNRLQTKEEQHDAHSVGKIVKQPVRNATPYFEMGLISTVYNACVGEQFELQTLLNEKVKNTVGHISLSFSPEDGARLRKTMRPPLSYARPPSTRKSTSTLGSSLAAPSVARLQEKPYIYARLREY